MENEAGSLAGMLATHYGLPGTVIAVLLVILVLQDKEKTKLHKEFAAALKAEQDARIADAQAYTKVALELQAHAIDAVHKLTALFEAVKDLKR